VKERGGGEGGGEGEEVGRGMGEGLVGKKVRVWRVCRVE
jgi:hypothetical protein